MLRQSLATRSKLFLLASTVSVNGALADGDSNQSGEAASLSPPAKIQFINLHDQSDTPMESLSDYDAYLVNVLKSGLPYWLETKMPLTVSFRPSGAADGFRVSYIDDVKKSLQGWTTALKGRMRFTFVNTAKADIEFVWTTDPKKLAIAGKDGCTTFSNSNQNSKSNKALITLMTVHQGHSINDSDMRTLTLHEIGHAIGLNGHSRDPADVMYPNNRQFSPSARDVKLFNYVYDTQPEVLFKDAMALAEKALSPDNPVLFKLTRGFARYYYRQKQYDLAAARYGKCVEIAKLAGDNKELDQCLTYLAACYELENRNEEAAATINSLLELRKKYTSAQSPDSSSKLLLDLANSYYGQKKYDLAATLYAKCAEDAKLSSDNRKLDVCLKFQAISYELQNSYDEATATVNSLLELRKKTTKAEGAEIAWCFYHLGFIADREKRYRDAEPYLKHAVSIYAKFPQDPSSASCLDEYNYMQKCMAPLAVK